MQHFILLGFSVLCLIMIPYCCNPMKSPCKPSNTNRSVAVCERAFKSFRKSMSSLACCQRFATHAMSNMPNLFHVPANLKVFCLLSTRQIHKQTFGTGTHTHTHTHETQTGTNRHTLNRVPYIDMEHFYAQNLMSLMSIHFCFISCILYGKLHAHVLCFIYKDTHTCIMCQMHVFL